MNSLTCPKCYGYGYVQHPEWQAYWEQHDELTPESVREHFEVPCWIEDPLEYDGLPPEEIVCDRCGGTGIVDFLKFMSQLNQECGR